MTDYVYTGRVGPSKVVPFPDTDDEYEPPVQVTGLEAPKQPKRSRFFPSSMMPRFSQTWFTTFSLFVGMLALGITVSRN